MTIIKVSTYLVKVYAQAENVAVFSVSELSQLLKRAVESQFAQVCVRGEISGFKLHSSGHAYFALRDADCVLDAVMWRGTKTTAPLQDGLEVIATGKLTTYGGRSKYQMVISHVEAAGQGALLKILQDRKIKLQKEGLFDRKRELPKFPSTIGVITSPTGAVIRDILHRIGDRFPCHVLVWPVLVQGPGSSDQITAAIKGFNNLAQRPDVLIVARGGGSLEDLWAFNEENVVRAAAFSEIPIISAVGHETDTTLIDFASDKRAPTPTAAAEFATPDQQSLKLFISESETRLQRITLQTQERYKLMLENLSRRIPDLPSIVLEKNQRLDEWFERYVRSSVVFLERQQHLLNAIKIPSALKNVEQAELQLEKAIQPLTTSFATSFSEKEQALKWQAMLLSQNSYQRTLEKGFCLVEGDKGVVRSAQTLKAMKEANIHFADGKVRVQPLKEQKTLF
jgi:exodeoxyribonuclease VII large subunit